VLPTFQLKGYALMTEKEEEEEEEEEPRNAPPRLEPLEKRKPPYLLYPSDNNFPDNAIFSFSSSWMRMVTRSTGTPSTVVTDRAISSEICFFWS
jgi:hypothetical protein